MHPDHWDPEIPGDMEGLEYGEDQENLENIQDSEDDLKI